MNFWPWSPEPDHYTGWIPKANVIEPYPIRPGPLNPFGVLKIARERWRGGGGEGGGWGKRAT